MVWDPRSHWTNAVCDLFPNWFRNHFRRAQVVEGWVKRRGKHPVPIASLWSTSSTTVPWLIRLPPNFLNGFANIYWSKVSHNCWYQNMGKLKKLLLIPFVRVSIYHAHLHGHSKSKIHTTLFILTWHDMTCGEYSQYILLLSKFWINVFNFHTFKSFEIHSWSPWRQNGSK